MPRWGQVPCWWERAGGALIFVDVGFWEQELNNLVTGIGGPGGFNAPLDIRSPDPTLPPYPAPSYYSRIPTLDDPAPHVPQHPPYIAEQDMETSNYLSLRPARVETRHGVAMTLGSERL